MEKYQIKAIGLFLANYDTDIEYINNYQKFIKNPVWEEKSTDFFYKFLIEFKVIRNISKDSTNDLFKYIIRWLKNSNISDVDTLTDELRKEIFTNGKKLTSLVSKILFLNNPWELIPMDRNSRNALGVKANNYQDFKIELEKYKVKERNTIEKCIEKTKPLIAPINEFYKSEIDKIDLIHRNRVIDKLLWVLGNKNQ